MRKKGIILEQKVRPVCVVAVFVYILFLQLKRIPFFKGPQPGNEFQYNRFPEPEGPSKAQ